MQPHTQGFSFDALTTWEHQRKIPGYKVGMVVGTTVMGYD